ncbi:cysteine--tRNA ligase [bacterium]|nr:cysteine--tRNA ligase [bacterium]
MMLTIYNTMTRKKEVFTPVHPPFVGMYVCGPTVYDDPHLGHAKSYISFDVIYRFLKASGFTVRYVQNITDVGHLLGDDGEGEDRILKKARVEQVEPVEIAQKYERHFFRDMDRLNCLRPDISSRATGHILEMIELIKKLIEKGNAYEQDGNVYFDLSTFPEYGKLSGRNVDDLLSGTRVKPAEGKRHSADFALWKRADGNHLMRWPSPWGTGFPGWHLECSVMSMKYIGETIDIHGGGLDNQFPHHECEIAQSESVTGHTFVNYWIHNNMVTLDGQKMSKSLGNHVTLEELFSTYDPMTVRFFVLQGHYRSPQDFSDEALSSARTGYGRLVRAVAKLRDTVGEPASETYPDRWEEYRKRFFDFLDDDFNTSGGITVLFDLVRETNTVLAGSKNRDDLQYLNALFHELGEGILGLVFASTPEASQGGTLTADLVNLLVRMRQEAKAGKNWAEADAIRDHLKSLGIVLEDTRDGTSWSLE